MSTKPSTVETTLPTYAEIVGEPSFDWWHALNNPDQYNHMDLITMASHWPTCACGNQCAIIERDKHGMPLDDKLKHLGTLFPLSIFDKRWETAKERLILIESRSAELINEILNKHE